MFFNLAFCLLIWQDKFGRAEKTLNDIQPKFQEVLSRFQEGDHHE